MKQTVCIFIIHITVYNEIYDLLKSTTGLLLFFASGAKKLGQFHIILLYQKKRRIYIYVS